MSERQSLLPKGHVLMVVWNDDGRLYMRSFKGIVPRDQHFPSWHDLLWWLTGTLYLYVWDGCVWTQQDSQLATCLGTIESYKVY